MFGIEVADASLLPAMAVALLAGFLSFLSPCVLPIVPPYVAYMSGISMGDLRQGRSAVVAAIFFVLGLSTIFLAMGAGASAFGMLFLSYKGTLETVAALIVMTFGAHFLGLFRLKFLDRDVRFDAGDRGGSAFGAYLLGLAFAFGWTPCMGPVLGSILSLAMQQGSVGSGAALLTVYAFGLGIPFILVAAFFPRLTGLMAFMKRHMDRIERVMGLLLWTVGLMMLTGGFAQFSGWLLNTLPPWLLLG